MPEKGFLFLSDITGYSVYLNESELEHAQSSLTDLLKVLMEYTRSPLVISKLEGDAVFSFASSGSFRFGQTLLETIEITYAAFRKALDLMVINTTCQCNACRNLPNLDLKFFVHFGEYSIQELGDFRELVGHDVNLVHRLMKNSIVEETGFKAYAAYTQAVVDELGMQELVQDMTLHRESYSDVGGVALFVQEIGSSWEKRKDEMRIVVEKDRAVAYREADFPVPPPILWDYLTKPEYRKFLFLSDSQRVDGGRTGRIGQNDVYVCAHGENIINQRITDWAPFDEYSTEDETPIGDVCSHVTYRLSPTEGGTHLTVLWGRHSGQRLAARFMDLLAPLFARFMFSRGEKILRDKVEEDLEQTEIMIYPRIEFGNELAAHAAANSLQSNMIEKN